MALFGDHILLALCVVCCVCASMCLECGEASLNIWSGLYVIWNWRPKFQAACLLVSIPPMLDISNGGCGVINKDGF